MGTESRAAIPLILVLGIALAACETEVEQGAGMEEDTAAMEAMEPGPGQPATMDTAADRQALEAMAEEWQQAANADDAAAVAALYTRDAMFVSSTGSAEGPQAIQQMLGESFQQAGELEITPGEVSMSGDVAWGNGTFSQTVTAGGAEQTVEGDYLVVVLRQPDGTWKIARHFSVTSPPEGPPEGAPQDTAGGSDEA